MAQTDDFERKTAESGTSWHRRLKAIDRNSLNPAEQVEYDSALDEARRADVSERKPGGQTPNWAT
jgi:hypothetical protein